MHLSAVVISTPSASDCDQFWFGGNDIDQSGNFTWLDGSSWKYDNWGSGQPDSSQHCVSSTARTTGLWKTEPCGVENCFICEMFAGASGSTSLPPTNTYSPTAPPTSMTDCWDWYALGNRSDGIYPINPGGKGSYNVFCDMTTDGGGWTVIQRRVDNTTSFYNKFWNEYKVGFNNGLENNLWLGNDRIHDLTTKDSNVELRIDLWGNRNPQTVSRYPLNVYVWEKRTNFYISDETDFYRLYISSSSIGNATLNSFNNLYNSYRMPFGTIDTRNSIPTHCFSAEQVGGWWLSNYCSYEALNGKYMPMTSGYGFFWVIGGTYINPLQSRMMLRSY
uniref:Fibrinogen C-terminal domain-containing protein n=1 Tax=Plectus sambesii TaxID=2011161 RepID=A0A914X7N8_9BILA